LQGSPGDVVLDSFTLDVVPDWVNDA